MKKEIKDNEAKSTPKLYLVPTPIGNMEDITLRAIRILKEVDCIFAEDTRTSGILLKHHGIENKLQSYHQFNEHKKAEEIVKLILSGSSAAIISDAGTPSISDAGFLVVRQCIKENIVVECLPGATAFVPALAVSGFPTDCFCFEGFLPQKKGREKKIKLLADEHRTIIFYESPYRILNLMELIGKFLGTDRQISVSRELSKMFEETVRGTSEEISRHFKENVLKGEFVVVVEGKKG